MSTTHAQAINVNLANGDVDMVSKFTACVAESSDQHTDAVVTFSR